MERLREQPGGWEARGKLKGPNHRPLSLDDLRAIVFGNGGGAGPTNVRRQGSSGRLAPL